MKCSLGISNFLERSLLFPILLFFSVSLSLSCKKLFLISSCCSLKLCIQLHVSFPFSFTFHFFSQLFVRPPQTVTLPSCISFSWGCFWSRPPVQYYKPPSIVLQAFYLPDQVLESIHYLHCKITRDLI